MSKRYFPEITGNHGDEVCCGFDVPKKNRWDPEDIAFWTATEHYAPWKDVAVFFKGTEP